MIKIVDKNGQPISYGKFNFPCGEAQVEIPLMIGEKINRPSDYVDVEFHFENNEEIVTLMMLVDSLKNLNVSLNNLIIPYFPFARQDRITHAGLAFSLKVFCNLVNSFGFRKVCVTDPHSDVVTALLDKPQIIEQWQIWENHKSLFKDAWLVSPDAGALKKIYKLASKVECKGVLEASKKRDVKTGEITGVKTSFHIEPDETLIIVDDICDGGGTFIQLAKELGPKFQPKKIVLCVTHGKFTKGLDVFEGLIDEIYTLKGKVK